MKKLESYKRLILIAMSSICLALQLGVYALFWYGYYSQRMYLKFYFKGHILMLFVYLVLLFFLAREDADEELLVALGLLLIL